MEHTFVTPLVDALDRCALCGVIRKYHQHHSYFGQIDGLCMACFESPYDMIHERGQIRVV